MYLVLNWILGTGWRDRQERESQSHSSTPVLHSAKDYTIDSDLAARA